MSKNVKEQEKMTKYQLKQQKREEEKAKEKREARIGTITLVVLVLAVVCFIASFPVRKYLAVNEEIVTVDGQAVTRVEFDYNYNIMKNNYMSQYGSMMSGFGVDLTGDLSTQMYSETLTWEDFFEQMAVESIAQNRAMTKAAQAEGFTYDTTQEVEDFNTAIEAEALLAGVTVDDYLKATYGELATKKEIEAFVAEAAVLNAYYNAITERNIPTEEEITAYYNENTDYYDSVDYRVTVVAAEVAEDATEEQKTAAMATAKEQADKALETVATDGELVEGMTISYSDYTVNGWLFDTARKAGDTTVIEDADNNQYYVLAFEKRYLDENPTVDVRVILAEQDGQAIVDEWKAGEATEDSFAALCETHSIDSYTAANGGLYEGISKAGLAPVLTDWLFAAERATGDVTSITTEDGYNYVMYYIGTNEPAWKMNIKTSLSNERTATYIEEISSAIEVVDNNNNLAYLSVEETASTEEADVAEATISTEEATETTQAAN